MRSAGAHGCTHDRTNRCGTLFYTVHGSVTPAAAECVDAREFDLSGHIRSAHVHRDLRSPRYACHAATCSTNANVAILPRAARLAYPDLWPCMLRRKDPLQTLRSMCHDEPCRSRLCTPVATANRSRRCWHSQREATRSQVTPLVCPTRTTVAHSTYCSFG